LRTPFEKRGYRWELKAAVFTSDAKITFATTNYGSLLSAWDVDRGTKLYDIAHLQGGGLLALSPDNRFLFFGTWERVGFYDVAARKPVPGSFTGAIQATAFSSDSRTMALARSDGLVTLVDVPNGNVIATADLRQRADTAMSLAFGRDHLWIGTARGAVFRVRLAGGWASR